MFTPSIKMWCGLRTWNLLNDLILEKMTTKVVYFTVGGKPEQAEFATDFPVDEIKGRISKCLHVQLDCPLLSDYYQALCVLRVILLRTSLLSRFLFIHWDYFNHLFTFDWYWKQNFLWTNLSPCSVDRSLFTRGNLITNAPVRSRFCLFIARFVFPLMFWIFHCIFQTCFVVQRKLARMIFWNSTTRKEI